MYKAKDKSFQNLPAQCFFEVFSSFTIMQVQLLKVKSTVFSFSELIAQGELHPMSTNMTHYSETSEFGKGLHQNDFQSPGLW